MRDNTGILVLGISVVAILVVAIRQNLLQDANDMVTMMKIGTHNAGYQLTPDRRKPIIISDKEVSLKQLYPSFFNNFTRDDWDEFWDILYGVHPLIKFSNDKLPAANRNLSVAEVQQVLIKRYPEAFTQFKEENWKTFWKEIMGILDYKLQLPSQDEWVQRQKDRSDARLDKKIQADGEKISATVEKVRKEIGN
jgi:hypothetical protein